MMDRGFPSHVSDAEIERIGQDATRRRAERAEKRIDELEAQLKEAQEKIWRYIETDQVKELKEQQQRLVELLKTSVAEFDDGIKYPLEVVNDLKQVLASMEPRKLTGYESEALNNALTASSKLVGKGMEKDDE